MTSTTEPPSSAANRLIAGAVNGRSLSVACGLGAGVLALALLSHDPEDASLWHATGGETANWIGAFGANLSRSLLSAIGGATWLIPLALGVWCWRLWSGRVARRVLNAVRIAAPAAGALLAAAAFLSAVPGKLAIGTGYGGWIGDRLILPFARMFDKMGFDAPYQIPGLVMAVIALAAFAAACGVTVPELRRVWRVSYARIRRSFSRERRLRAAAAVSRRAGDLAELLRRRPLTAERPVSLRGDGRGDLAPKRKKRKPAAKAAVTRAAEEDADDTEAAPPPRKKTRARAKAKRAAPSLDLLSVPQRPVRPLTPLELRAESASLLKVLNDYGVQGQVIGAKQGPVVTLHELDPAAGTKAARVVGLADDIARSMSALSARVAPVKGRSVIGIELPNERRETVYLREIMEPLIKSQEPLPMALGKEIDGKVKIASLAKMPHLLVAGTTGSGKSVALNGMILSLLYRHPPSECRMIMIDPKMLELSVYDGIPHLLSPVVTDPKKAVMALKWVVREMEGRYRKMAEQNVRNLDGYNQRMRDAIEAGETLQRLTTDEFGNDRIEEYEPETLPYIVVIVDEMADLMMVAGKEIEACIQRLAQMARASGIHIIMATQRPSVDVITGTIKANFPTRISFQVTSKIDSRTILGEQGAEQLLGQGDMLYMAGGGRITRVHGPFVSDEEVQRIASELQEMGEADDLVDFDEPSKDDGAINEILGLGGGGNGSDEDALYDQAVAIVAKERRATISYIQRRLQIGYNRAARIMEMMEEQGVISPANNAGKREILIEER